MSNWPNFDAIIKGATIRKIDGVTKKYDTNKECNGLSVCNNGHLLNSKCEKSSVIYKTTVFQHDKYTKNKSIPSKQMVTSAFVENNI